MLMGLCAVSGSLGGQWLSGVIAGVEKARTLIQSRCPVRAKLCGARELNVPQISLLLGCLLLH